MSRALLPTTRDSNYLPFHEKKLERFGDFWRDAPRRSVVRKSTRTALHGPMEVDPVPVDAKAEPFAEPELLDRAQTGPAESSEEKRARVAGGRLRSRGAVGYHLGLRSRSSGSTPGELGRSPRVPRGRHLPDPPSARRRPAGVRLRGSCEQPALEACGVGLWVWQLQYM